MNIEFTKDKNVCVHALSEALYETMRSFAGFLSTNDQGLPNDLADCPEIFIAAAYAASVKTFMSIKLDGGTPVSDTEAQALQISADTILVSLMKGTELTKVGLRIKPDGSRDMKDARNG